MITITRTLVSIAGLHIPALEVKKEGRFPKYLPLIIIAIMGVGIGIYVYYQRKKVEKNNDTAIDTSN